jgi:hypothetical protein
VDWNLVVHVLDELRDGARSLFELAHTFSRYGRASVVENLLYLADRELIKLSAGRTPFEAVPKAEWQRRLREAFEREESDPLAMTSTSLELTETGEQILQLFGIGRP